MYPPNACHSKKVEIFLVSLSPIQVIIIKLNFGSNLVLWRYLIVILNLSAKVIINLQRNYEFYYFSSNSF